MRTATATKQKQSLAVCQALIKNSLSCIAYLRNIFQEDHFSRDQMYKVPIRVVTRNQKSPGIHLHSILYAISRRFTCSLICGFITILLSMYLEVCQFVDWIEKGCFDALERGYLKSIVLGIYTDKHRPTEMVESYTFQITYHDDLSPQLHLSSHSNSRNNKLSGDIGSLGGEDLEKGTVQLLRTLLIMVQTLAPLPDERYLTMKLHYYDDRTPADYEPPLFRRGCGEAESVFYFNEEPMKLRIGRVEASHHAVDLRVYTLADTEPDDVDEDMGDIIEERHQHQNHDVDVVEVEEQQAGNVADAKDSQCIVSSPELVSDHSHVDSEPKSEEQQETIPLTPFYGNLKKVDSEVDCSCGEHVSDLDMICCDRCGKWQHTFCMGFEDVRCLPETHVCFKCKYAVELKADWSSERKLKVLCLKRRAACIVFREGFYGVKSLRTRLSIRDNGVWNDINEFLNDELLKPNSKSRIASRRFNTDDDRSILAKRNILSEQQVMSLFSKHASSTVSDNVIVDSSCEDLKIIQQIQEDPDETFTVPATQCTEIMDDLFVGKAMKRGLDDDIVTPSAIVAAKRAKVSLAQAPIRV